MSTQLITEMVEAIELNRTSDGRGFYPSLVFDSLPHGWLKRAKEFLGEPHNATPTQHETATDAEKAHGADS